MAKFVSIDELLDGMTLAEPVINNFGQTLLPSGTIINSKHLRILKTWNIRSLFVKSDDSDESSDISQELLNQVREKLLEKVKWMPRNQNEVDLFESAVLYISKYNSKRFNLDLDES